MFRAQSLLNKWHHDASAFGSRGTALPFATLTLRSPGVRRREVKALFVLITALATPMHALGCSCANSTPLEDQYPEFDQVFLGQISSVGPTETEPSTEAPVEFTIYVDVIEVYKGNPETEVIGTASGYFRDSPFPIARSSCGSGVLLGYLFVVFRNNGETPVFTGCSSKIRYVSPGYLAPLKKLSQHSNATPNK